MVPVIPIFTSFMMMCGFQRGQGPESWVQPPALHALWGGRDPTGLVRSVAPSLGSGQRLHHWGAALPWRTPLGGTLPCPSVLCLLPPHGIKPGPCPAFKGLRPMTCSFPSGLSREGPLSTGASQGASSPEEQTRTGLRWQNSPPGDNETLGPLCPPVAPRREVSPTPQPGAAGGPQTCRLGYQGGEGFTGHGVRPESADGWEEAWVKRAVSAWRHQGCRARCPRWVGTLTSRCASCFSQPKGMWWPYLPQAPTRAPEVAELRVQALDTVGGIGLTTERLAGPATWRPEPPGLCPLACPLQGPASPPRAAALGPAWQWRAWSSWPCPRQEAGLAETRPQPPCICSLCSRFPSVSMGVPWEAVTREQLQILRQVAGSESSPWTTTAASTAV